ncbi:hypothetical protein HK101_008853 [Irineochytrium annulatum]|nr:hypothetical protein HK101_008853 [Irineochytrium annulatum]
MSLREQELLLELEIIRERRRILELERAAKEEDRRTIEAITMYNLSAGAAATGGAPVPSAAKMFPTQALGPAAPLDLDELLASLSGPSLPGTIDGFGLSDGGPLPDLTHGDIMASTPGVGPWYSPPPPSALGVNGELLDMDAMLRSHGLGPNEALNGTAHDTTAMALPSPPTSLIQHSSRDAEFAEHDNTLLDVDPDSDPAPPSSCKKSTAKGGSGTGVVRRKKLVRELACTCLRCNAAMATLILTYQASPAFTSQPSEPTFTVQAVCLSCCDTGTGVSGAAATVMGRKRKKGTGAMAELVDGGGVEVFGGGMEELGSDAAEIECALCESRQGIGRVKFENAIQVGLEVVCVRCREEFQVCSHCGGGAGQWRPKQLFSPGRKTCNLSHKRLGKPENFRYVVYEIPVRPPGAEVLPTGTTLNARLYKDNVMSSIPYTDIPAAEAIERIVSDAELTYNDAWMNLMALPYCMKDGRLTFDHLLARRACAFYNLETFIRGQHRPSHTPAGAVRRYLAVGFTPSANPASRGYDLTGILALQWDVATRTASVGESAHHAKVYLSKASMLPHLIAASIESLARDALVSQGALPCPEHVWARLHKENRAQWKVIRAMGLVPVEEYEKRMGLKRGDVGTDNGYSGDCLGELTVFVISWADAVRLGQCG